MGPWGGVLYNIKGLLEKMVICKNDINIYYWTPGGGNSL